MSGPCAKTTGTCVITSPRGRVFVGTNACESPQPTCPRAPGEDYTKCKTICRQGGHAEVQALALAGEGARGGLAVITGHTYACQSCQEALFGAGIRWISVRPFVKEAGKCKT
jgi:deoxycytidylate deaminase